MQYVHAGPPGQERTFLLLVPSGYNAENPAPLWILAPGGFDAPETFLDMSGMMAFSERRNFVVATLHGEDHLLNVGLHGRSLPGLPDDIGYTRAVLQKVTQNLCIDMDRIRCAGFSRGARFCSRAASELSSFFAGIAAVSGLRFPSPNNATRPMPLITFHGTKDRINPYWGDGDPKYWHASVDDTVKRWVDFNGCSEHKWKRLSPQVVASHHTKCTDRADVVLVIVEGGGHTWPGSSFAVDTHKFGRTTHEIMANDLIWNFFVQHPRDSGCHTAERDEPCHAAVEEAMLNGLDHHPEWRDRLTYSSSFRDFQTVLHDDILADCPRPCPPPTVPPLPTTTTMTTTTATTTTATSTATTTTVSTTTVSTTTVSTTTISSTLTTTTTLIPPTATITSTTATTTTATTTTATTTTATTATATATTATATSTRTTATRTSTTGTTTTTQPPTTTRALDPRVSALDGSWTHKSDPGRFVEIIRGGMVHWDNGPTKEIHVQENGLFATPWQGQTYHCHLLGGELLWDDGDVWIRVQPAPGQGSIPASQGAVVTVRRIEDTASSAWWARLPGGAAVAAAGAGGAVPAALAAAGLSLVLGLVLWRAGRPRPRPDGYSGLHRSPVVPFELLHEPSPHDHALLAE